MLRVPNARQDRRVDVNLLGHLVAFGIIFGRIVLITVSEAPDGFLNVGADQAFRLVDGD